MTPLEQKLIEQLQHRNGDRVTATDGGLHPRKAVAPVSLNGLQATEKSLGFNLPEFVQTIYLNVGNGGFGPEYGIVGTKGGPKLDGHTLESCYKAMLQLKKENPVWCWPKQLLPLANYGCGMWACVDCLNARLPMILWDPNNLESDLEADDARENWGNSFWDQGITIKAWLSGWLVGKAEPEPKWPSDSWMKKRLGFALPN